MFLLLLLLFLLMQMVAFAFLKGVEDVGVEEGGIYGVQVGLQAVNVGVQTGVENFGNGVELEFCEEASGEFFGVVGEASGCDAGDVAQGGVELLDAKTDRAGKVFREEEQVGNLDEMNFGTVDVLVGVPGAACAQDGGEGKDGGGRGGRFGSAGGKGGVLVGAVGDVEDAGGFVGAFDVFSEVNEVPAFFPDNRGDSEALEKQGSVFDFLEKFGGGVAEVLPGLGGAEIEIETVDFFPEFDGDLVSDDAGVLACLSDGTEDGIGVLTLENKKFRDGFSCGSGVEGGEEGFVSGTLDDRSPINGERVVIEGADVEEVLKVHVHEAGGVVGAFEVAAHPVKAVGDSA
jgi:hypothetical protein